MLCCNFYMCLYWTDGTRLVPDGSTETFISSLRNSSQEGCTAKILSDNGGVFLAAISFCYVK